jgi:uncharacterized coiled-coil protein SlyX
MLEEREVFKVTNDQEAEWVIEKYNEEMLEKARYKESLQAKMEGLQEKLRKLENEEREAKERRDSYLIEYFESIDDKFKKKTKTQEKYRLPSGEIIKKYPNPEFKRDNNKLLKWIKANELDYVEVKETPKWGELKKVIKVINGQVVTENGEIIEGVEVVERPPVMEFKEV